MSPGKASGIVHLCSYSSRDLASLHIIIIVIIIISIYVLLAWYCYIIRTRDHSSIALIFCIIISVIAFISLSSPYHDHHHAPKRSAYIHERQSYFHRPWPGNFTNCLVVLETPPVRADRFETLVRHSEPISSSSSWGLTRPYNPKNNTEKLNLLLLSIY